MADGPLPQLPAGAPKLAFGLDQRKESLSKYEVLGRNLSTSSQYGRDVAAAFAELSVPVLSNVNLSLAARYESYNGSQRTFNPKLGLRWAVNESLRLRGSWGTSFREPTLADLYDHSIDRAVLVPVLNPKVPEGFSLIMLEQGSNPDLREETAKTWATGIDFAPESLPGLTMSSTFYSIDFENRIFHFTPTVTLESLLTDPQWSPVVTQNPLRSELDPICKSPVYFGSVRDCLQASPSAILDLRVRNLSSTTVKGIDGEVQRLLRTREGTFDFELKGSYLLRFAQAVTSSAKVVDVAGQALNPPTLRFRATADWCEHGFNQPGFGASLTTNYISGFHEDAAAPGPHIPSLTTFDTQLNYRTAKGTSWLNGTSVVLNVADVFNQDPPFVNRVEGYDYANAKPYGRVVSLTVRKDW